MRGDIRLKEMLVVAYIVDRDGVLNNVDCLKSKFVEFCAEEAARRSSRT